jgi:coenzyme PQQ synthesis protein D (PqqD)
MTEVNTKLSNQTVVVATRDEVSCKLGEEAAILGLKNSVYYGLNAVGARIWELLREPKSLEEVQSTILNEYDVSLEQAEGDLRQFLRGMMAEGLIELSESGDSSRSGRETSS